MPMGSYGKKGKSGNQSLVDAMFQAKGKSKKAKDYDPSSAVRKGELKKGKKGKK